MIHLLLGSIAWLICIAAMLILQELLLVILIRIFDCLGLSRIVLVLHLIFRELLLKDKSKGFRPTVN